MRCGRRFISPGRPVHLGGFLTGTNIYSHHRTSRFVATNIISIGNRIMARLNAGVGHTSIIGFRSRAMDVRHGICILLGGPGSYIAASSSPRTHLAMVSLIGKTYDRHVCPMKHLSHGAANILLLAGSNSLTSGLARPGFLGGGVCRICLSGGLAGTSVSRVTTNIRLRSNRVRTSTVDCTSSVGHSRINVRVRSKGGHVIHHVFRSLNCGIMGLSHMFFTNLAGGKLHHNR